tara:strand:+ start:297 stop:731 length:435 start_codon:yes stop_codon:yes gene_type:complete
MAIAINGSGTVTGISVGGLPDGIVDTDMLAANAVTDPKENLSGTAKLWINFNGTGTVAIQDSFNVSSITDLSTGKYKITYSSAFSNTNYCILTGQATKNENDSDSRFITEVLERTTSYMEVEHAFIENGSTRDDSNFMYFAVMA